MNWLQVAFGGFISVLAALGTNLLFIGPMRRKYGAESKNLEATAASTLTGSALQRMEAAERRAEVASVRADRCAQRVDELSEHIDQLERMLRDNGIPPPRVPTPLPWPPIPGQQGPSGT